MKFSEPHDEIVAAFFRAKQNMGDVIKERTNPAFKSKYADLAAVVDAVDPALVAEGILTLQDPSTSADGGVVTVTTRLEHVPSGQWMESDLGMRPAKVDPQGVGSTITYARRYALVTICGVTPEDDDGNAGMRGSGAPKPVAAATPVPRSATPGAPKADSGGTARALSIANQLGIVEGDLPPAQQRAALRRWAFEQGVCDDSIKTGFTPEHLVAITRALVERAEQRGLDLPADGWKMSGHQRGLLMALHGSLEHSDDDRHALYERITGKVSSSKFSRADFDAVLGELERQVAASQPPEDWEPSEEYAHA